MRLRFRLPEVLPTVYPVPRCPLCQSLHVQLRQSVPKALRDRNVEQVSAERYDCRNCERTVRHYPLGVSQAHTDHAPPLPGMPHGNAGVREANRRLRAAFPDTVHIIEDQIAEGDRMITRLRARLLRQLIGDGRLRHERHGSHHLLPISALRARLQTHLAVRRTCTTVIRIPYRPRLRNLYFCWREASAAPGSGIR
jgi:hypothetical protein